MKIFASGCAQPVFKPGESIDVSLERVVGVIDLGPNNGSNYYGWCGEKAILSIDEELFILDYPEDIRIETDDGVFVCEVYDNVFPWYPSVAACSRYDLFIFSLSMFENAKPV